MLFVFVGRGGMKMLDIQTLWKGQFDPCVALVFQNAREVLERPVVSQNIDENTQDNE